jgi:hypothetical protein
MMCNMQKEGDGMGVLKVFGIIAAFVFIVFVMIIAMLGFGVFSLVTSIGSYVVEEANTPVKQQLVMQQGRPTVVVPLREQRGIKYDHLDVCTPHQKPGEDGFDPDIDGNGLLSTSTCSNRGCTVTFDIDEDDRVPEYVSISVRSPDGTCRSTTFPTKEHLTVLEYKATVEFTGALLDALALKSTEYKVGSAQSNGHTVWQFMGTKKASFSYPKKVSGDRLLIDGKPVADIRFE